MNQYRLLQILRSPHVSEKTMRVGEDARQVVFHVLPDATKPEIKAAVEQLFEVKVESVRVLNTKGKTKRMGRNIGTRSGRRKAYVKLAEGSDIDLMSGAE